MSRARRLVLCLAVVLGLACGAAIAKPNFSGEWQINVAKSDFGPFPAPTKFVRKVDHQEPNLHSVTTQASSRGELTTELKYTTDGKECTNIIRGEEVKGTAKWEGDVLVIDSKRSMRGAELTFHEEWTLSEDGKTLTITNRISGAQGELTMKVVLDKQ